MGTPPHAVCSAPCALADCSLPFAPPGAGFGSASTAHVLGWVEQGQHWGWAGICRHAAGSHISPCQHVLPGRLGGSMLLWLPALLRLAPQPWPPATRGGAWSSLTPSYSLGTRKGWGDTGRQGAGSRTQHRSHNHRSCSAQTLWSKGRCELMAATLSPPETSILSIAPLRPAPGPAPHCACLSWGVTWGYLHLPAPKDHSGGRGLQSKAGESGGEGWGGGVRGHNANPCTGQLGRRAGKTSKAWQALWDGMPSH